MDIAVTSSSSRKAVSLTGLYSFCSRTNCADGEYPMSGLIIGENGNLYGTTNGGGPDLALCNNDHGCGTVFEITPNRELTTLYNFCSETNCADGYLPRATLIQARNGKLYGTTEFGAAHNDGTLFELTLTGKLTKLHTFDGSDGANPWAPLLEAPDGSFYGTTQSGGSGAWGTVFRIMKK